MMNTITALCTSCDLHKLAKINCLRGCGPAQADMMFVGEAPGEEEDLSNRPFVGPSGDVLDRLLFRAGVTRDSVYVTNAVKCRPVDEAFFRMDRRGQKHFGNLTPTPQQSYTCASKHLEEEIARVRPKVIVSMGNVATDYLLGKYELLPNGKLRMSDKGDKPVMVKRLPGITDLMYGEYWDERRRAYVVPMFHPSYIMRSPDCFLMMCAIIRKAVSIVANGPGKERTQHFIATNFDDAMAVARRALENRRVAYDHETDGLDWRFGPLINTGFSWKAGTGATIRWIDEKRQPLYSPQQRAQIVEALRGVFQSPDKELITYNGPFDDGWSWQHFGYEVRTPEHDVQQIYHTLNSAATYREQSLESLSWLHTQMHDYKAESKPWFSKKQFVECPIEIMGRRNCADADATLRLFEGLMPTLQESPTYPHYERTIRHLPRMSTLINRNGCPVSLPTLHQMRERLEAAILDLGEQFRVGTGSPEKVEVVVKTKSKGVAGTKIKLVPYNSGSPKHLGWTLFEHLKLPVIMRTPKGSPKLDEYVITELAKMNPSLQPLLEQRKFKKLLGTYVYGLRGCALFGNSRKRKPDLWTVQEAVTAGFQTDGRVHPTCSTTGTVTGRPSLSNPNVANQPRPTDQQKALGVVMRRAFEAPEGHWILECDLSQAELRALAAESGDEVLLAAVNSPEGVHKRTAAKFYSVAVETVTKDQKDSSKTVVFAIVYGGSEYTVEEQIPEVLDAELRRRNKAVLVAQGKIDAELDQMADDYIPSKPERLALAKEWVESFRAQYPKAAAWIEATKEFARKNGFVKSAFGRVFHFPLIFSDNFQVRSSCERQCVNYPLQSVVPDITFAAAVRIQAEIERRGYKSLLINMVYDALYYQVPDAELDAMKILVPQEMERPVPELKVNITSEMKVGHAWAEEKSEDKAPVLDEPALDDEDSDDEDEEEGE